MRYKPGNASEKTTLMKRKRRKGMKTKKVTVFGLGTALLLGLGMTVQADEEKVLNFGCAMYRMIFLHPHFGLSES